MHIPDGAICVKRGKKTWTCLVEVKTGSAPIKVDQLERYLELARLNDFDALLTISNQIRPDPEELPYKVNKVKVGKLTLRHISWWRVLTEAITIRSCSQHPAPRACHAAAWSSLISKRATATPPLAGS